MQRVPVVVPSSDTFIVVVYLVAGTSSCGISTRGFIFHFHLILLLQLMNHIHVSLIQ